MFFITCGFLSEFTGLSRRAGTRSDCFANWKICLCLSSATTNFVKPAKEKLVVYELLVRDFDANRIRLD
jgi:hypothetical protein